MRESSNAVQFDRIPGLEDRSVRLVHGRKSGLHQSFRGKIGPIVPNWVIPGSKVPFRPVVVTDCVRLVGECVALVVAETLAEAYDAVGFPGPKHSGDRQIAFDRSGRFPACDTVSVEDKVLQFAHIYCPPIAH
jgi:hypothetical protein